MDPHAERRALAQSTVQGLSLSGDIASRPPEKVARWWVVSRPWVMLVALIVGGAGLALARDELSPMRLAIVGGMTLVLMGLVVVQAWLARRGGVGRRGVFLSLLASILVAAVIAGGSGGLASPYAIFLAGPSIVVIAAFGPGREAAFTLALLALALLALALLPAEVRGPRFSRHAHEMLTLIAIVLVVGLCTVELSVLSKGLLATSRSLRAVSEELLQEVAARRREIEGLGAKVAHEIKNPLTALKSLLQLERAAAKEERSLRRFEVMASEVARMETIVRDYLTFARPLGVMALADVDLGRIADDVVTVLEGRAGDAGVSLRREGRSATIMGDERRLKEVLLNLGQNALEATPRGGTVSIAVEPTGDGARVIVRDSGSGIAPQVMGKLGTSFVTTREQGTGLGLAIARSIVKQHHGTFELSNRPEGGAVATVFLPRRPRSEANGPSASG